MRLLGLKKTTFPLLFVGAVVAGAAQYIPLILSLGATSTVALGGIDIADVAGSGPLKYVKDIFLIVLAILPLLKSDVITKNRLVVMPFIYYAGWLAAILSIGTVSLLVDALEGIEGESLYFVAGARWIILLNGGVSLFTFASGHPLNERQQARIALALIVILGIDLLFVVQQAQTLSLVYQLEAGTGGARMVGVFTSAGTAGTLAILAGIVAIMLPRAGTFYRVCLLAAATMIGLAAGSRFSLLANGMLVFPLATAYLRRYKSAPAMVLKGLIVLLMLIAASFFYGRMNESAGRGDLLENQIDEGGRFWGIIQLLHVIGEEDLWRVALGNGLGVGTNNAQAVLGAVGSSSGSQFNTVTTDNTFVVIFNQFGVLGSLVFWGGIAVFFGKLISKTTGEARRKILALGLVSMLAFVATSMFEQYFLIIGLFSAFGVIYASNQPLPMVRNTLVRR